MLIQTWKMAWSAVCANKLRTVLTMLGILIGVAALIVLVSIADGASGSVSSQISDMGTNYLSVRITDDKENPLRLTEFQELFKDDAIKAVAPMGMTSVTGKSGYTSGTVTVYGTSGSYFQIMDMELASGRGLKQTDIENHSYVIILSADTAVEFFGHADVEGESIMLDGKKFLVAGVLSEEDVSPSSLSAMAGSSNDNDGDSTATVVLEGYVPYSTWTRMADNGLDITQFYVSSADEESMDAAERAVEQIMRNRFDNDADAFSIQNQSDLMEAMAEVNNTFAWMLGGIAVISLMVGGIGIMNIMLVSVTERTREIGIRKAIGARQGSIMLQFLMEAVIVSMAGCITGIAASWGTLKIIDNVMGDTMTCQMNGKVVLVAVVFSAAIGILFGIYPARKAAKKKPMDALRYS